VSGNHLQALEQRKSFHRKVFINRDDLLAARWWFDGMQSTSALAPNRRSALKFLVGMGGLVGAGLLLRAGCNAFDETAITLDALELQRKEGWAVGAQGTSLLFPDSVRTDSAGDSNFAASLSTLGQDLAPNAPALDPYFVPTLFEVLNNPRGADLVSLIRPMNNPIMEVANHAAQALASMFSKEEDWKETALILDLPGPESVAAAAGVARIFTPVFLYDNWPHPLGVVPSHQTLAAALYHRPDLIAARAERQTPTTPAFVLDSRRLSPYRDESDRFDNRYLARMPSADALDTLGIKRVLYVTANAEKQEQDDLNDDFVALRNKFIDVKMVALSDFAPASEQVLRESNMPVTDRSYYYGGHPHGAFFFWSSYHWYSPSTSGRTFTGTLPRPVSTGRSFSPTSRPTLFSSRTVGGLSGVGKQKPSGFGRVSYRSGSGSLGRSGSFGRAGSSSFG
jgi:hypothetical protein